MTLFLHVIIILLHECFNFHRGHSLGFTPEKWVNGSVSGTVLCLPLTHPTPLTLTSLLSPSHPLNRN